MRPIDLAGIFGPREPPALGICEKANLSMMKEIIIMLAKKLAQAVATADAGSEELLLSSGPFLCKIVVSCAKFESVLLATADEPVDPQRY